MQNYTAGLEILSKPGRKRRRRKVDVKQHSQYKR